MLAKDLKSSSDQSAEKVTDLTLFQARQAFDDLEGWLLSQEAMTLPHHDIEVEMERRGREISRLMLQAHLNRRGTGNVGHAMEVVRDNRQVRQVAKRTDPGPIVSIFGKVGVQRTAYMARGEESIHPLDEGLQLPERMFSREIQRRVVEQAVRGPFDEAIDSLQETTGNRLSKRTAEDILRDAARDFDDFYKQRAAPPTEGSGSILVATVDCKGVPMVKSELQEPTVRRKKGQKANKKKMATVAAVYTQQPRVRTPQEVVSSLFDKERSEEARRERPESKRVWASLEKSKDEVIESVAEEMAVRNPNNNKVQVAVTDGERALQKRLKKALVGVLLVLDIFHALERLWKVGHALYAEGSEEAKAWVRKHALMLLEGRASQVIKGMRQSCTKRGLRGSKRKAINEAAGYLYRNRGHMRYNEYLQKGLPIGSGVVEGTCRNLVKDRMERAGMRWTKQGAEAMLKMRALERSGDLAEYWGFHIEQDCQRLYGTYHWNVA